jgi:hypothetical protein
MGSGGWTDRPDHDKAYPDIAILIELVPTFSIAAGQSQSIYADIYIPRSAMPGLYQGTVTVQQESTTVNVPVQLTVFNFALPDVPMAKIMLYYSSPDINKRFFGSNYVDPNSNSGAQARVIRDRYFQMATRNRISLIGDDTDH